MNALDKHYIALLEDILEYGTKKQTRNGEVLSLFGRQIRHRMNEGFPLITTKKVHFKSIVSELLWFLQGRTDLRWLLEQGNTIWVGDAYKKYIMLPKELSEVVSDSEKFNGRNFTQEEFINKIKTDDEFAKKWGSLGKIYGYQWRNWDGRIDQISELIRLLKETPDSRRMVVNAWAVHDLPNMTLPPCHYGFQVYTRELTWEEQVQWVMKNTDVEWENLYIVEEIAKDSTPKRAISLMFNMRSVDTPLGLPFNIASYGLLLELLAKMTNMVPGELIGNLGDCHIYTNQIDGVKEQISREPFELPKLNINTEWWPTESGECGVGPIDAQAVLRSFSNDAFCKCLLEEDIQLWNYQCHPKISMPLSN